MSTGVPAFLLIARVTSNKEFNSDCLFNNNLINSSSPEDCPVFCISVSEILNYRKKYESDAVALRFYIEGIS